MDGLVPILILLSIVASIAVAIVASKRGRNGFGWFFISVVLSPLFGVLLLIALPVIEPEEDVNWTDCPLCKAGKTHMVCLKGN